MALRASGRSDMPLAISLIAALGYGRRAGTGGRSWARSSWVPRGRLGGGVAAVGGEALDQRGDQREVSVLGVLGIRSVGRGGPVGQVLIVAVGGTSVSGSSAAHHPLPRISFTAVWASAELSVGVRRVPGSGGGCHRAGCRPADPGREWSCDWSLWAGPVACDGWARRSPSGGYVLIFLWVLGAGCWVRWRVRGDVIDEVVIVVVDLLDNLVRRARSSGAVCSWRWTSA